MSKLTNRLASIGLVVEEVPETKCIFREEDGFTVVMQPDQITIFSASMVDTAHIDRRDDALWLSEIVRLSELSKQAHELLYEEPDFNCIPTRTLSRLTTKELVDRYHEQEVVVSQNKGKGTWQSDRSLHGAFLDKVYIKNALTLKAYG